MNRLEHSKEGRRGSRAGRMRTPKSAILEKHHCARVCRASLRIAINNTLILGCFQPYQCYNNLFIINTRYDSFVISNIYIHICRGGSSPVGKGIGICSGEDDGEDGSRANPAPPTAGPNTSCAHE